MNQLSPFQPDLLKGKVAFVAGGSSGINLEVARSFAQFGAKVFIISRSAERVAGAVAGIKQEGFVANGAPADVRDYEAVEKTMDACVQAYGRLDIVLSGAAGNFLAPAVSLSAKGFKTVVDIDLIGTFNVFRAAFGRLNKPASLMAITAPQAISPMPFQVHASAAKAGINIVVKCLALEWGGAGVRVNGISPGPIADTEGMKRLAGDSEASNSAKQRIALGRWGETRDIAAAALYLASPAAAYVTGTILEVEGGVRLGDASADMLTPWKREERDS